MQVANQIDWLRETVELPSRSTTEQAGDEAPPVRGAVRQSNRNYQKSP